MRLTNLYEAKKTWREKSKVAREFQRFVNLNDDELEKWRHNDLNLKISTNAGYRHIVDLIRLTSTPTDHWTEDDYKIASKAVGMIKALLNSERGEPVDDNEFPNPMGLTKRDITLLNWGHRIDPRRSYSKEKKEMDIAGSVKQHVVAHVPDDEEGPKGKKLS